MQLLIKSWTKPNSKRYRHTYFNKILTIKLFISLTYIFRCIDGLLMYAVLYGYMSRFRRFSSYQLNAHFLYSITIYMLYYNPQHVSSSTLLIFRRTNCTVTASGIVTLCKLRPLSTGILYGCLQRVTIPKAAIIQ